VRHGFVGCIELGQTEVAKMVGGVLYMGVVTRFQQPHYQVTYEGDDTEEHTGRKLARILKLKVNEITDPRRFCYDWSGLSMTDVPGFVEHLVGYLAQYSMKLPSVWTSTSANAEEVFKDDLVSVDAIEAFLREEEIELRIFHEGLLSSARAARTLRNCRLPALKLVWYALTRRLSWPLAGDTFEVYLAKLHKERDNIGAPTTTKNAVSLLCSMNDVDPAPYNTLRVTEAVEAARRDHKHVVKKSAGLTVGMMWHISRRYAFARPGRARELQWEFAFSTAVSVAFKILLRYDDLARCLWGPGYCDVFHTHVRFCVEGRKNAAHECAFLDIARPADDNPDGIYFVIVRAKDCFRTGYVLPHIDHRTGAVNHTLTMSIGNFVAFLRAALVNIGLTKEEAALFAGQSARAGGATEAAAKGLHQEDFNTWRASPPRNGSPGTTADTSRSGFASRAPSASEPLKRKVGVGKN
jgi:hypothetical protein